jgi:hypothetical protein
MEPDPLFPVAISPVRHCPVTQDLGDALERESGDEIVAGFA